MKRNNKAQAMLGYVVLLAVVLAGLLIMRSFMSGTVQEKWRQSIDVIGQGEQFDKGRTQTQYAGTQWENDKEKCAEVQRHVEALMKQLGELDVRMQQLEKEIKDLEQRADFLKKRADDLEQQAKRLDDAANYQPSPGADEIVVILQNAAKLRKAKVPLLKEAERLLEEVLKRKEKIKKLIEEKQKIEDKIKEIIQNYPQCFM